MAYDRKSQRAISRFSFLLAVDKTNVEHVSSDGTPRGASKVVNDMIDRYAYLMNSHQSLVEFGFSEAELASLVEIIGPRTERRIRMLGIREQMLTDIGEQSPSQRWSRLHTIIGRLPPLDLVVLIDWIARQHATACQRSFSEGSAA